MEERSLKNSKPLKINDSFRKCNISLESDIMLNERSVIAICNLRSFFAKSVTCASDPYLTLPLNYFCFCKIKHTTKHGWTTVTNYLVLYPSSLSRTQYLNGGSPSLGVHWGSIKIKLTVIH